MKKLWLISVFAIMGVIFGVSEIACVKAEPTMKTYTNPLGNIRNIGDPFVLKYNQHYYLYATSISSYGFYVWESDNLVDWKLKGEALNNMANGNSWGTGDFWAPEVIFYQGKFYMTYSASDGAGHKKIALAMADKPEGPFKNIKTPLIDPKYGSWIDASIFVDDNGTPYIAFVKDCSENVIGGRHVSQIYIQEFSADLLSLKGKPVLAVKPSQAWEHPDRDWSWNEGPFLLKHDGIYYLMYSSNVFDSPDYAVGYATAKSPLGPWTKYAKNPILAKNMDIGVSGPGHNSVTSSPDGKELFIVYHAHSNPQLPSGDRNLNIDRLYFENGVLKVQGPTRSAQPFPSGAQ